MSFSSSHCSLVFVLSDHAWHVPVLASVCKAWVKIMHFFSALLSHCLFHTPCFPSSSVWLPWCCDIIIWGSLLGSLRAPPLWKRTSQQHRKNPQAFLMPFLPLLLITGASFLVFSGSDCADVFPSLSLIGKSHWRCKTAYELWLQKREKFSSERLRSGQSICTLTGEI